LGRKYRVLEGTFFQFVVVASTVRVSLPTHAADLAPFEGGHFSWGSTVPIIEKEEAAQFGGRSKSSDP
jgi:hypothetical protein